MVSGPVPSQPAVRLIGEAVPARSGMASPEEDPMFGYGWGAGMGAGGWLLMALLWGGFLAVVIWAVTRLFPRSRAGTGDDAASRPGRREIGEDTYRRLRGELTKTG
jgi:putative membrane protein